MKLNEPSKNSLTEETSKGNVSWVRICDLPDDENKELQDFFAEIESDRSAEELKEYMKKVN